MPCVLFCRITRADLCPMMQKQFNDEWYGLESTTSKSTDLSYLDEYFEVREGKIKVNWWRVLRNIGRIVARVAYQWAKQKYGYRVGL
jgi:hypothetical protein